MLTAIVLYRLPPSIGREECARHFAKIAADFKDVPGLQSKRFIWNETGKAGGVYLWDNIGSARAFYSGPWLDGILERYGTYPDITYFETMAITDNATASIEVYEPEAA